MEINREDIKKEILELFGEKVYQIFANNQGAPNDSEFLDSLSFQEVISLNNDSSKNSIILLLEKYKEKNISLAIDFLESFQKFIKFYHDKNPFFTELEKSFGSAEYKNLLVNKSIEIFNLDTNRYLNKMYILLKTNKNFVGEFKIKVCDGKDFTLFSDQEFRSNIQTFSKINITKYLNFFYRDYRTKYLIQFDPFLSSDKNVSEAILEYLN